VLTAYRDEVGEATLILHVLDYTKQEGGSVEWCHWDAVRWRGDDSVSIFSVDGDGWNLRRESEVVLSEEDVDALQDAAEDFENSESGSREVAEALLPHLRSVMDLEVWDRQEQLWCCDEPIVVVLEDDYMQFVLERPVLVLPTRRK
jgi:hypothetical protein